MRIGNEYVQAGSYRKKFRCSARAADGERGAGLSRAWSRWSGRQQRKMTSGGWIGAVHVEPCAPALSAALAIGARLGLGKETVFGMGRYELALS